nr:hypothetical protein [Enhygromyxa salina]
MTFVGGFFADKILGFRKSITWGGLLMIVGSFTVAAAPSELFYIGTSITIVGTGFFKPNISGIVGLLYHDGDKRRDARLWAVLLRDQHRGRAWRVVKFGHGFFFVTGGFYLFHSLMRYAESDGISSLALFSLAWLVMTVGELCLSPIGDDPALAQAHIWDHHGPVVSGERVWSILGRTTGRGDGQR